MRRYPLSLWMGIVFSVSLTLSALYWDESRVIFSPTSTWANIAQLNREYRAEAQRLRLPDGSTWPESLPYSGRDPDGTRISYGAGLGLKWAQRRWFDAWAAVAASETLSADARAAACTELSRFPTMRAFRDREDIESMKVMVSDAQRGEYSRIQEYVRMMQSAYGSEE